MEPEYKALYEAALLEISFLKKEREKLKAENDLLEKIRMIQAEHLLKREKKIKELERKE